jgi:L-aspartate oxidase
MDHLLYSDVVVIGAGLAGLVTARHLVGRGVTVLAPTARPGASFLARGGIAAALDEGDSPELHVRDTLRAGAGLSIPEVAEILAEEGLDRIIELFELDVPFDRDPQGRLLLGQEALHDHPRILHAAGDDTGRFLTHAVREDLTHRQDVAFVDGRALELLSDGERICGVIFEESGCRQATAILTSAVVLATGGSGALFGCTTNPECALGEGIALAARQGAALADLEFVQFHPTALAVGCGEVRRLPLLSEAIRGRGGRLVDREGGRIMAGHPRGDLAGRDVIAREVFRRLREKREVYLDVRHLEQFGKDFPTAWRACEEEGLDPAVDLLPILPAAHFHMGGVATDSDGKTSLPGLWAVGEVASTGVHGANRLASNSLLEALVFGARVGRDISHRARRPHQLPLQQAHRKGRLWSRGLQVALDPVPTLSEIQRLLWEGVGIVRTKQGLEQAGRGLDALVSERDPFDPVLLALEAARLVVEAALRRRESRGAHFRQDFPDTDPAQAHRSFLHPHRCSIPHPLQGG